MLILVCQPIFLLLFLLLLLLLLTTICPEPFSLLVLQSQIFPQHMQTKARWPFQFSITHELAVSVMGCVGREEGWQCNHGSGNNNNHKTTDTIGQEIFHEVQGFAVSLFFYLYVSMYMSSKLIFLSPCCVDCVCHSSIVCKCSYLQMLRIIIIIISFQIISLCKQLL